MFGVMGKLERWKYQAVKYLMTRSAILTGLALPRFSRPRCWCAYGRALCSAGPNCALSDCLAVVAAPLWSSLSDNVIRCRTFSDKWNVFCPNSPFLPLLCDSCL